jgi:lipid-binding SYLF domain-containing protein
MLLEKETVRFSKPFCYVPLWTNEKSAQISYSMKGIPMKTNFRIPVLLLVMLVALTLTHPAQADKFTDTIEIYKKSEAVKPLFKNAYGYVVFPTVGKGGLGIGGAYGKGQVYRGGKVTGEASLVKLSIGWQAGGQAFSQMIFFEDKRAYDEFTSGSFEFDASASAVAINAGAQAKAGTEGATAGASAGPATGKQAKASYHKGMAVFVHTKGGLMYEAAIGGQKFNFKPKQ